MGNLSYCRFGNTSGDLIDCQEAIENGEMSVDMSDDEREGLEIILNACEEIYHMSDEIKEALKRWDDNDEQMKREEEKERKEAQREAEKEDKKQVQLIKKFASWTKGYETFKTLPKNHVSYKPKFI